MPEAADTAVLQNARKIVSQCDRCGACLPVCPLFGTRDVEVSSARGKNAIVRALAEGGIDPAPDVVKAVDFCLLCQACVANCPSKVRTDEAMIDVRQYLADRTGGAALQHRAAGAFLKSRGLVRMASGVLSVLRRMGLGGLFPHGLAPEEYTRAHFLAAFAGPATLGRTAPASDVALTTATKVAYFHGCGMRMMFPAAARRSLKILRTTAPVIEKDNLCCGLPHLAHGLRGDFLDLVKKNIRLYEDCDVIVSDCASCGGTLKHTATFLKDDPDWRDRATAFSRKAMDLTEYLVKAGYSPRSRVDALLTYHDPCHLVRGQGISRQPRELLAAAGRFVEMEEADTCCAGGGSFPMDHPSAADKILATKRANIEKTGAAVVVTGCPGCLIQLTKAAKAGGAFKAMHISQVI